jgi:hypothetical protein
MTITPEQWDLAKLHVYMASELIRDGTPDHNVSNDSIRRKLALGHLDIARQALNPVTDEERAGS